MAEKTHSEKTHAADAERLSEAVQATQSTSAELRKDAAALVHQAGVLQARNAETKAAAQAARAAARETRLTAQEARAGKLTIPEAARQLHIAERTLRALLEQPDFQARLVETNCKVGLYYRFIPLLPPDLMADLTARFTAKKPTP